MTTPERFPGGSVGPLVGVDHLVALQSARRRLLDALEGLDEDAAGQVVHGEWRVRDLLSHLASWDRLLQQFLLDLAAGRRDFEVTATPENDWAAWNALQVAAGAARPLSEQFDELEAAREALLDATYALDQGALDLRVLAPWGFEDSVLGHILTQAVHDSQHADVIRAARAGR